MKLAKCTSPHRTTSRIAEERTEDMFAGNILVMLIDRQENWRRDSFSRQQYPCDRKGRKFLFCLLTMLALLLAFGANSTFAANDTDDDGRQQAALRALMARNPAPADTVKGVALAPWTHGPSSSGPLWVVAALVQLSDEHVDAQLWTGVLTHDDHGFRLLVSNRSERVDTSPLLWNASLTMDVIPYRISDQETAFGVRFNNNYSSTAHSDTTEILSLYRYADAQLVPVFSALTDSSTYDKSGVEDCVEKKARKGKDPSDAQQAACDAENTTEAHYVLSFSPHMTNGHYDLLVRPKGTATAGKGARFTWSGLTYQPRQFLGGLR